jgi:hypothetical protein
VRNDITARTNGWERKETAIGIHPGWEKDRNHRKNVREKSAIHDKVLNGWRSGKIREIAVVDR